MQFGLDENKDRIRPSFSGQKATCPLCGSLLIGHCGKIYKRHWQHYRTIECDSWHEPETLWHIEWKSRFPTDWQEVIIVRDGKKHIADVKTQSGIVIEFQNSSISSSTIATRENFYQDMIWVVNAEPFKDNILKWHIVTSELSEIKVEAARNIMELENFYKEDLRLHSIKIVKNQREISQMNYDIEHKNDSLNKLKTALENYKAISDAIIEKWSKGDSYFDQNISYVIDEISSDLKNQLHAIPLDIERLNNDIGLCDKKIKKISELDNYVIYGKTYKISSYQDLNSTSFERVRAIEKESFHTFFHKLIEFKSESDFKNISHTFDKYIFVVDPTNALRVLKQKIEELKESIERLQNNLSILHEEIPNQLLKALKNKIEIFDNEKVALKNELDSLLKQHDVLVDFNKKLIEAKEFEVAKSKQELEEQTKIKLNKLMQEKQGLYGYEWRHQRKSWSEANCKIYLDFGDSCLYEVLPYRMLRRIELNKFLEQYIR